MYVCICNAITDKEIRRAAASGAENLFELQEQLGVATRCGSCADQARDILNEVHGQQHRATPSLYVPALA